MLSRVVARRSKPASPRGPLTARYRRDRDRFWVVELAGEARVHSYGRTLAKARANIIDAAALWYRTDRDDLVVVDDVELPEEVTAAVARARHERADAETATARAALSARAAAAGLVESAGLSVRDAAELLGVSYQRVHQLLERPGRDATTARRSGG